MVNLQKSSATGGPAASISETAAIAWAARALKVREVKRRARAAAREAERAVFEEEREVMGALTLNMKAKTGGPIAPII